MLSHACAEQVRTLARGDIGMQFVQIPAGSFIMGALMGEFILHYGPLPPEWRAYDEIQHKVTFSRPFYMQATEVTQGQWKAIMGNNPSRFKDCGDSYPVENVSWNDCQEFLRRLNEREGVNKYRLPTEAEWEYACRAGTTTPFNTGYSLNSDSANIGGKWPMPGNSKSMFRGGTISVGSFLPNSWGLYDMHGNVWEWVQDWYGEYPSGDIVDTGGPTSGERRSFRGGRWDSDEWHCRSAYRCENDPDRHYHGFRVVMTINESTSHPNMGLKSKAVDTTLANNSE